MSSPLQLVFKSVNGNTLKPEISLKHFKASCARAKIELNGRTQYSLRHTFDTDLLKQLNRDTVNDLMGILLQTLIAALFQHDPCEHRRYSYCV